MNIDVNEMHLHKFDLLKDALRCFPVTKIFCIHSFIH